jgi:glycosidase
MTYFPSPTDWRDLVVYQIFTDRFQSGDPKLRHAHPEAKYEPHAPKGLHGGDLPGIQQRLDYIKGLGADAIWISPVFLNDGRSAYHGYCTSNFRVISPHLGGLPALRDLIRAAHERGIYVLLDIICNHMGRRVTSSSPEYPRFRHPPHAYRLRWIDPKRKYPPPFNRIDCFHNHGYIENFEGEELVLGALSGLDDLRTERSDIRDYLTETYRWLISETDCDGFRIDTVRHVEWSFWREFAPAMHRHAASLGKRRFLLLGEVWEHDDAKLGQFLGRCRPLDRRELEDGAGPQRLLDSVTDFPLYYALSDVFFRQRPPSLLRTRWQRLLEGPYDKAYIEQLLSFLDNHDVPRFLWRGNGTWSRQQREALLRAALAYLFFMPGIPCVYQGTEQGFHGGPDPLNREDMAGCFDRSHPLYRWIARLARLRRRRPAWRRGAVRFHQADAHGPGVLAVERAAKEDRALLVINTAATHRPMNPIRTGFPAHSELRDALEQARPARVDAAGRLEGRRIPPRSVRLYLPA